MSAFKHNQEYIALREYVNVNQWHDAGHLGRGLQIFCDDVGGRHVELIVDILETILPESIIFTGGIGYRIQHGSVVESVVRCDTTGESMLLDDFIKKYKIRLINNSTTGTQGAIVTPVGAFMKNRIEKNKLIMTASAGNGFGQPINTRYYGAAILVTSVKMLDNVKIASARCAEGKGIDFSMFYGPMPGTSYSAPFLLGMIGLLLGKYPYMDQQEVYNYLKDHCIPLGSKEVFGHGLPVLGRV